METKKKIEIFGKRLKVVAEGIETMKHFGLSEEILLAWLCHKMKISEKTGRKIIKCHGEFYDELINKMTEEQI